MKHEERPLDMLQRQLTANRTAIKFRHPVTGQRHFCHLPEYREAYIKDVFALKKAIRALPGVTIEDLK
jgi:hypothetical protein